MLLWVCWFWISPYCRLRRNYVRLCSQGWELMMDDVTAVKEEIKGRKMAAEEEPEAENGWQHLIDHCWGFWNPTFIKKAKCSESGVLKWRFNFICKARSVRPPWGIAIYMVEEVRHCGQHQRRRCFQYAASARLRWGCTRFLHVPQVPAPIPSLSPVTAGSLEPRPALNESPSDVWYFAKVKE